MHHYIGSSRQRPDIGKEVCYYREHVAPVIEQIISLIAGWQFTLLLCKITVETVQRKSKNSCYAVYYDIEVDHLNC